MRMVLYFLTMSKARNRWRLVKKNSAETFLDQLAQRFEMYGEENVPRKVIINNTGSNFADSIYTQEQSSNVLVPKKSMAM